MNLDKLLGSMTIEQLKDLAELWTPNAQVSSSKLALFRTLRQAMTDSKNIRRCFELTDLFGQGVVRKLLRSENQSQSIAVLAASSAARPKSIQETRGAITDLAAIGFVFIVPERRWEAYGSARVGIPDELAEPLREITGIEARNWFELMNLREYLAALPEYELASRLEPHKINAASPHTEIVAELASEDSCRKRLALLSDDVREMIHNAVHQHAGIASVARLQKALGLGLPEIKQAALKLWKRQLESALIGVIADVSLLDYGIDLDGQMLIIFDEVVEFILSEPIAAAPNLPDAVGPDFLLDLHELISIVRESAVKLRGTGAISGVAAQRINSKLNRPHLPLMNELDLLEFRVTCAEKLGLLERTPDSLAVRESAWAWEQRSLEQKAADLFDLVGRAAPKPRSKHHHDGLCQFAVSLVREMTPGQWVSADYLRCIALRRYLGQLRDSDMRDSIAREVHQVEKYILPPFPSLKLLGSDLEQSVVTEAYAMGVLDSSDAKCMRLSDFGAIAVGKLTPKPPAKLIITPDFEIIILPEGDTTRLRYEVGQFAASEKFEQTYHLRVTRDRVEEAVVRGILADDMISVLRDRSSSPVPQNIEYSIRAWAGRVRVAIVEHVHVFELGDETLLSLVSELPAIKSLVVRRISPTALALREWPNDRKLLAELERLGIFVR